MKKLIFLLTILGASLGSYGNQAQAVGLTLTPPAKDIGMGSVAAVDLHISGLGNHTSPSLGVFDLDVTFDASILSFLGATFGEFLGDPVLGANTEVILSRGAANLFEASFLEEDSATCFFCVPPYLSERQPSSFLLATLLFKGVGEGGSLLDLQVKGLGDGNGVPLSVTNTTGSTINVTSSNGSALTVVSELSTVLLLISCVLGAMVWKWGHLAIAGRTTYSRRRRLKI